MIKNIVIYIILPVLISAAPMHASAQQETGAPSVNAVLDDYEMPRSVSNDTAVVIDTLDVRDMDLKDVLQMISLRTGVQINFDNNVSGKVTVLLKDINIYDALRVVLEEHDLAYVQLKSSEDPTENVLQILTQERFESLYGYPFTEKRTTDIVGIFYVDPLRLQKEMERIKTSDGKTLYDEYTHSMILIDAPAQVFEMKEYIEKMDVPSATKTIGAQSDDQNQDTEEENDDLFSFFKSTDRERGERYNAKIHIIEITLNDEYQDGVDWEAIVADYKSLPFLGFRSTAKHDPEGELRVGVISDEDYDILMEALDAVGLIETLDQRDFRGRLKKEYEVDIKPSDKLLVTDIREYKDMFKRDELVKINVTVDKDSEGLFQVAMAPAIRPNYYNRDIGKLESSVQNGYVVVIGGIFKDIKVEGTSKIPILGDLPFLGFAFRDNEERIRKVEYVVFLSLERIEE